MHVFRVFFLVVRLLQGPTGQLRVYKGKMRSALSVQYPSCIDNNFNWATAKRFFWCCSRFYASLLFWNKGVWITQMRSKEYKCCFTSIFYCALRYILRLEPDSAKDESLVAKRSLEIYGDTGGETGENESWEIPPKDVLKTQAAIRTQPTGI